MAPRNKRRSGPDGRACDRAERFEGTVTRVDSRMCRVQSDDGSVERCRVRGRLFREERRYTRPVAVGDRVVVARTRTPPSVVEEVKERKTILARPRPDRRREQIIAANIDQAVLVHSISDPDFNPRLLDRMLVACELGGFDVIITLNKVDLSPSIDGEPLLESVYRPLGYPVLYTSVKNGRGIDDLRERLTGRISVFAGMSGVGKSSLLNAVQEGLRLAVGDVSAATGKGRLTTTHASLLALDAGGFVVDTPGIREWGIERLDPYVVGLQFREFVPFAARCRFRTCQHSHEHDCAVKAAVEGGDIDPRRYESYLRIVESIPVD